MSCAKGLHDLHVFAGIAEKITKPAMPAMNTGGATEKATGKEAKRTPVDIAPMQLPFASMAYVAGDSSVARQKLLEQLAVADAGTMDVSFHTPHTC